jgi:hypothetical protein
MTAGADLAPGELVLRSWPARFSGGANSRPTSGELTLTNRRLFFSARAGFFGRSRTGSPVSSVPLENIGGGAPHPTEMPIGYGDRMILDGVDVGGATYELGRERRSQEILQAIASARRARRLELGLADDISPCRSCGRWGAAGTTLCEGCARAQKVPR